MILGLPLEKNYLPKLRYATVVNDEQNQYTT